MPERKQEQYDVEIHRVSLRLGKSRCSIGYVLKGRTYTLFAWCLDSNHFETFEIKGVGAVLVSMANLLKQRLHPRSSVWLAINGHEIL